jgi:threonine dehydrogenase-like Zn-dependent dehydrogenase
MAIDGIGATFGAFEMLGINAKDTLLITGLGPVGLGGVVNARFRGTQVIGVEPSAWRKDLAIQMGAEAVFDPNDPDVQKKIDGLTNGRGVTCAMDCSGMVSAQRLCIDAAGRRGRVAFVGESSNDLTIKASPDFIRKGLTLVGSWLYNTNDYPKVMQVIQQSPLINLLVSHCLPMSQIQEAFELMVSGECAKVVVDPWK